MTYNTFIFLCTLLNEIQERSKGLFGDVGDEPMVELMNSIYFYLHFQEPSIPIYKYGVRLQKKLWEI